MSTPAVAESRGLVCRFTVEGRAVPWKVPLVVRRNGKGRCAVKNTALSDWQYLVHIIARRAMTDARRKPVAGPVVLEVGLTMEDRPGHNPDLCNLVKAIEDALQGACYVNDTQVCRHRTSRTYGEPEGVEVAVYTLEPSP